jgi:hypothetical protein
MFQNGSGQLRMVKEVNDDSRRSRMVNDGSRWFRMVREGLKSFKMAQDVSGCCRMVQDSSVHAEWPTMVENGPERVIQEYAIVSSMVVG